MMGDEYLRYLQTAYQSMSGQADLCALFFLQTFDKLNANGNIGLITTNTISQGDTRETGLETIIKNGGDIFKAESSTPWPGVAAVYVAVVHITKGKYSGGKSLDNKTVNIITPLLDSTSTLGNPYRLAQNANKSFLGSNVLGIDFVMPPEQAKKLIERNPQNAEVLFPFLNGQDLNSRSDQSASRWAINFFDWPLEKAGRYTDCMSIVKEKVYPVRQGDKRKIYREHWWHYGEKRPGLYSAIAELHRVLVKTRVTKTHAPTFVPNNMVYSDALVVFALDNAFSYIVLQSSFHEQWAWKYSSTLKSDLRYSISDSFETFPFPNPEPETLNPELEKIGELYHEHRRQIMLARQEGLTANYNRFHHPEETAADIIRLRELHVQMDQAVAAAYGWHDLSLDHGFHQTAQGLRYTISESARREVLGRLLELNHRRYAEEVALGLHDKKKGSKRKGSAGEEDEGDEIGGQLSMF